MKLNGWQRLWALLAVSWAAITIFLIYRSWPQLVTGDNPLLEVRPTAAQRAIDLSRARQQHLVFGIEFWAVPMFSLYALGYGFAWVRRGFKQQK